MRTLPPALSRLFLAVDLGFLAYWAITALHLLPPQWLYSDYANPIVVSWNWSFLPLDLAVSATGLTALLQYRRGHAAWSGWATVSLSLTSASGLQAISFWVFQHDFDPVWWALNLFLLLYPWLFLPKFLSAPPGHVPLRADPSPSP